MTTQNQPTNPSQAQSLFIPATPRTWDSFFSRIQSLLADETAHLYIDTSFLMWLTKIGEPSRKELFTWLTDTLKDRLHVPIWSAHEYLKHYTRSTIPDEFTTLQREVQSFAQRTYARLRPFIDEPIRPHVRDPMTLRSDIRSALHTLDTLLDRTKHWKGRYERHAEDMIRFINDHTPSKSSLYTDLQSVSSYADPRLRNMIPPGFKDLWKSQDQKGDSSAQGNEVSPRASVYGDLLLWKEILDHARSLSATGIILISNDRKNDWLMRPQNAQHPDHPDLRKIRRPWKPIPRPHPILAFEAHTQADINCLEVIDCVYLAAYLHIASVDAHAFIDVALTPDPPDDDSPPSQTSPAHSDMGSPSVEVDDPVSTEQSFPDPRGVHITSPKLWSALKGSRESPLDSDSQLILDSWNRPRSGPLTEHEVFAGNQLNVDHKHLVAAARALHDGALAQKPGFCETLDDIAAALDLFPPNTASSIYTGLLASMYLNNNRSDPRFPPRSPIAKRLFQLQNSHFSRHATNVLSRQLLRSAERPLYVPSREHRELTFIFRTEPDRMPPGQLASMCIDFLDVPGDSFPLELLSPVKTRDQLHLATLLGVDANVTPQRLIDQASEIYTFPTTSVNIVGPMLEAYFIPEALSFRDPRDIRIQKESKDDAD